MYRYLAMFANSQRKWIKTHFFRDKTEICSENSWKSRRFETMTMKTLLFLLCVVGCSLQLKLNGCTGSPNNEPIYSDPPVFVNSTTNGKLFLLKSVEPPISVIHLYGSAYEMVWFKALVNNSTVLGICSRIFDENNHQCVLQPIFRMGLWSNCQRDQWSPCFFAAINWSKSTSFLLQIINF